MPSLEQRTEAFLQSRQELQQALRAFNEVNGVTLNYLAERFEAHLEHMEQVGNPHGLTKEDFGLELIENIPPATIEDIINGINEDRLLTPRTYKLLIEQRASQGGSLTNPIRTPVAINPVDSETTANVGVTLKADDYRTIYRNSDNTSVPFKERVFQLDYINNDFSNPLFEKTVESFEVLVDVDLPIGETLKWRCKDKDIYGQEGSWSLPAVFDILSIGVERPVVTHTYLNDQVPDKAIFKSSPLSVIGGTDVLESVRWELKLANDDELIWLSSPFSPSEGSQVVEIPENILEEDRWYQLRSIYFTENLGEKESTPIVFKTMDEFKYEPGKRLLTHGDSGLGYYETLGSDVFPSAREIMTLTGIGEGTTSTWDETLNWFKMTVSDQVVYVPQYPVRRDVTVTHLNNLGLNSGKVIEIEGTEFLIKTPSLEEYTAFINLVSEHGEPGYLGIGARDLGFNGTYVNNLLDDGSVRGDGTIDPQLYDSVFCDTCSFTQGSSWRPFIFVIEQTDM